MSRLTEQRKEERESNHLPSNISCYIFTPISLVSTWVHGYNWLQRRPEEELLLGGYVPSNSIEQEDITIIKPKALDKIPSTYVRQI